MVYEPGVPPILCGFDFNLGRLRREWGVWSSSFLRGHCEQRCSCEEWLQLLKCTENKEEEEEARDILHMSALDIYVKSELASSYLYVLPQHRR